MLITCEIYCQKQQTELYKLWHVKNKHTFNNISDSLCFTQAHFAIKKGWNGNTYNVITAMLGMEERN